MWHADPHHHPSRMARARRPLIVAAIVGGAILQHVMVSTPPEPVPAPLPAPGFGIPAQAPAPAAHAPAATLPHAAPKRRLRPGSHPSSVVKGTHLLASQAPAPSAARASAGRATPDPTLTAGIRRAFDAYALPYVQDSALIVAVARQFGIDPAIPAALFMHEDGNINNRAIFPEHMNWLLYYTRNPGNIRCMYDPCHDGYQVYPTYRAGILDWFRLYDHYYFDLGIHDLARFVATYCPPNVDGNGPTSAYLADVLTIASHIRSTS